MLAKLFDAGTIRLHVCTPDTVTRYLACSRAALIDFEGAPFDEALSRIEFLSKTLPVVALTARNEGHTVAAAFRAGVSDVFFTDDPDSALRQRLAHILALGPDLQGARLSSIPAADAIWREEIEDELARAKALLDAAIEQSPAGILIADAPDVRIRIANRAALGIRGASSAQLTDIPIEFHPSNWRTYHPDGSPFEPEQLPLSRAILEGFRTSNVEVVIERCDGDRRNVLASASPIKNSRGAIVAGIAVFADITKRVQAERALAESERRFRAIFNNTIQFMGLLEVDGRIIEANQASLKFAGLRKDDVIGRPIWETPWWKDLPEQHEALHRAVVAAAEGRTVHLETPHVGRTGEHRFFAFSVKPVQDSDGNIAYLVAEGRDITPLKHTEEALRRSEQWLSTILNSVADAVITTDTLGIISFFNPIAAMMTGYEIEEAIGRPISEVFRLVDEHTREAVPSLVDRVLANRKIVGTVSQSILISKDGRERHIADSGAPIASDDKEIIGVAIVFRDVSDHLAREAMLRHQQKMEALGTLAGGVAHEINNPINIIMNYGQLIQDSVDAESQVAADARVIVNESRRIATIVKNLLSFSRQENEAHTPLRVDEILDATMSLTQKLLSRDQIVVSIDVEPGIPKIRCRNQQIMQVLMNLLTNARDALNERYPGYDDNKSVRIRVESLTKEQEPWIRICVEDNGCGIRDQIKSRIFDPFFTSKPRDRGTGLGLAVSYGIVSEHGGELSFESTAGVGSRFFVDLPVIE